jgi:ribonuclease VapC
VLEGKSGERGGEQLDLFLARAQIKVEPVTAEQVSIARKAWRRYGKGSGHPAGLNFGDCFSYALAQSLGEELLYKGSDFAQTDIARTVADSL